ncbi:MAG TPA: SLC13 family permease, partial [Ferrovibrio sp.]
FINNATTAVVLAPIALELARTTGTPPQPLLMAVALGASTDFLTPFGHHNNTLAFGIGGYRFGEFLKVGWPLTLASFAAGVMLISLIWG